LGAAPPRQARGRPAARRGDAPTTPRRAAPRPQGCAALQVAAGLLVMRRCLVRNSSIGLEIARE
jgi:hypothetical protein